MVNIKNAGTDEELYFEGKPKDRENITAPAKRLKTCSLILHLQLNKKSKLFMITVWIFILAES